MAAAESAEKTPAPSRVGEVGQTEHATRLGERSAGVPGSLQHALNNSPLVVAQRQRQQALDASPRVLAQRQALPNRTGLPDQLKAGVESLSGHSLDDVTVHYNSSKPALLQAHAYAQGTDIHIAPGQEQHLPHEAWHVVQQKQGRVKATMQLKDIAVNDDSSLEREADAMGAKAQQEQAASTTAKLVQRVPRTVVQRIVRIESVDYVAEKPKGAQKLFSTGEFYDGDNDELEETIILALLNSPQQFNFSRESWEIEIRMRKALIEGMEMLNDDNTQYDYNWETEDLKLPPAWTPIPFKTEGSQKDNPASGAFMPKERTQPSKAIEQLFAPGDDEEYYLDCSSAILATQYRALMVALEEAGRDGEFDRAFGKPGAMVINPAGVTEVTPVQDKPQAPPGDNLSVEVRVKSVEELIPGDLVYFINYADYDKTHTGPEAAWAGEHAVYRGDDRYQGFGSGIKTLQDMVTLLQTNYNGQGLKESSAKKTKPEDASDSMTGKRPGISKAVRRVKSDISG